VAKRFEPIQTASSIDHGIPLLLDQLVETLKSEQAASARNGNSQPTPEPAPAPAPAPTPIGRAAAIHGAELLRRGYTIDQVVHDYGDVCQSVTALAIERSAVISSDEFRTLNRCLDNAIADAVVAFGEAHQTAINRQAEDLQQRFADYTADHRRLIAITLQSFAALKTGNIGIGGATGSLLEHSLKELASLTDRLQLPPPAK